MKKRILAILMAVLMAALCCSVGFADDDEKVVDRGPITRKVQGTYSGHDYCLDATASSSSQIKSTGTYGVNANLRLRFVPTITYPTDNGTVSITASSNSVAYGTVYTTSLTKSYTPSQAAAYMYVYYPDGSFGPLSYILPSNAYYTSCVYKLEVNSTIVATITVNY